MADPARIVIIGGGYVGATTARQLRKRLTAEEAQLTVIDPRSYMTYQPFLAEAAAGSVEPRHVVVPLREVLPGCKVMAAEATGVDTTSKSVTLRVADGHVEQLGYDILVVAPGSVSKTLPIPGLAEHGIGFKTLEEAVYLRNHVLSRLDLAASTMDRELRRKLLTFVFVGGGYAGIEAMAELEDMTRHALKDYGIDRSELRWVLVEAADRIMPEVSSSLASYTLDVLTKRGFEVHLGTTLKSCEDCHVVLGDDTEFDADTIVWTAGVKPSPMLADTDLPLNPRGRVCCATTLEVDGAPGVFSAGDAAAVPDVTSKEPGAVCAPSAQHASRQAVVLAKNIVATLRGGPLAGYRHSYAGSVASLGLYQGVAQIYGVKLRGWPAWALHRAYHLMTMPTAHRKTRIAADWLISLPFRRQVVATGEQHHPREQFVRASQR
ncbi:NAD(P)/FAD-dependent oxidoreductase [Amycolatopsis sp. 3B14]|uniref:NAD(P)/FAD-dependent oxidoreductase n=1 Tax=Amycolatopsis TaxID=1813 RepID=UPI003D96FC24